MENYRVDAEKILYFPFQCSKDDAMKRALSYLAEQDYTPIAILNTDKLSPYKYYAPSYYIRYQYDGNFSADLVHMHYTTVRERDPETKKYEDTVKTYHTTERVFDRVNGFIPIFISGIETHACIDSLIATVNYHKHLKKAVPSKDSDCIEEPYTLPLEDAEFVEGQKLARNLIKDQTIKNFPNNDGHEGYELNISLIAKEVSCIFLPIWRFDYSYNGKTNHIYIDAIENHITYDELPIDTKKKKAVSSLRVAFYLIGITLSISASIYDYAAYVDKEPFSSDLSYIFVLVVSLIIVSFVTELTILFKKARWKGRKKNHIKKLLTRTEN